jgi:hypothetical protein
LTTLAIPDGIASIERYTFQDCTSLISVTLPSTITNIGYSAFSRCASLTSLNIPDAVHGIESTAFEYCTSLTSIKLPSSLSSIPTYIFYYCTNLINVTIPKGVLALGAGAFSYCSQLVGVYFLGDAPTPPFPSAFDGAPLVIVYYMPTANYWNSTFNGRPAVLWNPQFQTGDSSFGMQSNGFSFHVTGTTKIPIVVEAATNLTGSVWVVLRSGSLTNGSAYFMDPDWTNYPARFYRLRSP